MANSRTLEPDLLIVGGGVQGLTLLHHLSEDQRRSALLVTRDPLGQGETLHSHGYLHRGYFLSADEAELIPDFVESFNWWSTWMNRQGLDYQETATVLFDLADADYDAITGIWNAANLPFEPLTNLPGVLKGGSYSRAQRRRLVRIHDRLIPPRQIVEALSAPVTSHLLQGEVASLTWDSGTNRIVECVVSTPVDDIRVRPGFVVLATGRQTQPLLRKIAGPDGTHPLDERLQGRNLLRDVPMILVEGPGLPSLSGWFQVDTPIAVMTHSSGDGEPMWVVTPMEDHHTSREDFQGGSAAVEPSVIAETLRVLQAMVPGLEGLSGRLRVSSYIGTKVDHPEGLRKWFIGNAGVENLRLAWPVLWGFAQRTSRDLVREIFDTPLLVPTLTEDGAGFDEASSGILTGVGLGDEKRLASSLSWRAFEDSRAD